MGKKRETSDREMEVLKIKNLEILELKKKSLN